MVRPVRILTLGGKILLGILVAIFIVLMIFSVLALLRERSSNRDLAPSAGRFVDAGDVDLYIQTAGEETDPPILLIHGMAAWSETWRPVMEMLDEEGWYVIAVDMPPFGFSDRPVPGEYWRASQAARLSALLDSLGHSSATVVGHSYGGRAVLEFAMLHPARVDGMILVDPALSGIYGPAAPAPLLARGALSLPPLRHGIAAATITNPLLARTLLGVFLYDKSDATDEIVAVYGAPRTIDGSTAAVGRWLQGFVRNDDVGLSSDVAHFADFKVPTVLIWGEEDTTTPYAQAIELQGLLSGSVLYGMPGVGHIPHIENPPGFNGMLKQALYHL